MLFDNGVGQYSPAEQSTQVEMSLAPEAGLKVPASHGVGNEAARGQKAPAGHIVDVKLAQKYPGGQE